MITNQQFNTLKSSNRLCSLLAGLAFGLGLNLGNPVARANIYATNIKIDDTLTGTASVSPVGGASISYILNETATAGVSIQFLSGNTPMRTISISATNHGTAQGLNKVVWDLKNDSGSYVASGTYSVRITAASLGHSVWTQIVSGNAGDPGLWPSGIAVDTNQKSPYYGRVMVADSPGTSGAVLKCNADATLADEGQSNAGYSFLTDGTPGDSVRSLKYGSEDRIYFDQWTAYGQIVACDMLMSTNQILWDSANLPGAPWVGSLGVGFGDIDVTGFGATNANGTSAALAWLTDSDNPSAGVWVWPLTNNGAYDPNFPGLQIIGPASNACAIATRTGDGMMADSRGDIFVGQTKEQLEAYPALFAFTNTLSLTNPICSQNLAWSAGATNDSFDAVEEVAIDSRTSPNYVSMAMSGGSGGLLILNASNGLVLTNINQTPTPSVYYIATCWDAVGNVYGGNTAHSWQAFSPPGPNTNSTLAVVTAQVLAPPTITMSSITVSNGTVRIPFTSSTGDPSVAFTLLGSAAVAGPYTAAAGANITGGAGSYTATVPASGNAHYYRIKR